MKSIFLVFARRSVTVLLTALTIAAMARPATAETSCDVRVRADFADGSQPSTVFHEIKKVPESMPTTRDEFVLYEWENFKVTAGMLFQSGLSIVWRDTKTGVSFGASEPVRGNPLNFTYSDPRRGGRSVIVQCSGD